MKKAIVVIILVSIGTHSAFAEQIFITLREDADNTIFDGKWTFQQEWKNTSEDVITFDGGNKLAIRTGHDFENLYVFVDFISDTSIQKSADKSFVCIDSKMNGGNVPQSDDYCFMISVGSHNPITLQGGHKLAQTGYLAKIPNHPSLIAVGGVSDNNDRYSDVPHASYEFKIPLEIFGKSDKYGFYVVAYDAKANKAYSWPMYTATEKYPFLAPPDKWGQLISPDKSIPEFEWPVFVILPALLIVICLTRFRTMISCRL